MKSSNNDDVFRLGRDPPFPSVSFLSIFKKSQHFGKVGSGPFPPFPFFIFELHALINFQKDCATNPHKSLEETYLFLSPFSIPFPAHYMFYLDIYLITHIWTCCKPFFPTASSWYAHGSPSLLLDSLTVSMSSQTLYIDRAPQDACQFPHLTEWSRFRVQWLSPLILEDAKPTQV